MDFVPLSPKHVEPAARLFAERYRLQRETLPALPSRHESAEGAVKLLGELANRAPGVVALEGDLLRGYLVGMPIPSFFGNQKGTLVPLWGHAAEGAGRGGIYHGLYASLAARWVDAGYLNHAITLYADDAEAQTAFYWNCFGLQVVDAVRAAEPIASPELHEVEVRQASPDDVAVATELSEALWRYIASSPILFPLFRLPTTEKWAEWLAEDRHVLWLAFAGDEAIGYIRLEPPTFDVALAVHDPGTIAISGAFVLPEWRRHGVAQLILSRAVDWARATGYERISVDFEAANRLGGSFWLSHFEPICHSLLRKVDERILWGRSDAPADRIW